MLTATLQCLCAEMEAFRKEEQGQEYWMARDIFKLLRLNHWLQFVEIIQSAADHVLRKEQGPDRHFREASVPSVDADALPLDDYRLSAYGGFLVAKHLNDQITPVRFLLNYFPAAERDWLSLSVRIDAWERLRARADLRQTEKDFSHVVRQYHLDSEGYGLLKSQGDMTLFGGLNTREMKERLGLDGNDTLSDYLPATTLRARRHADELTIKAIGDNPRRTEDQLAELHRASNMEARQALLEKWITPEWMPRLPHVHVLEKAFKEDLERIAGLSLP